MRKGLVVLLAAVVVSATLIDCPSAFAGSVWSLYINNVNTSPAPPITQNHQANIYAEIITKLVPIQCGDGHVYLTCYIARPGQDYEMWDQDYLCFNLEPGQTCTWHFNPIYTFGEVGYYRIRVVMTDPREGGAIVSEITYGIDVVPERGYLHVQVRNDDDDTHTVEYKIDYGDYNRQLIVNPGETVFGPDILVDSGSHSVKIRWFDDDVGQQLTDSKSHTVSPGERQAYTFTLPLHIPNPYRITFTSPAIEEITIKQGTLIKMRAMLVDTNTWGLVNDANVVATPGNGDLPVTLTGRGNGLYEGYWYAQTVSNNFSMVAVATKDLQTVSDQFTCTVLDPNALEIGNIGAHWNDVNTSVDISFHVWDPWVGASITNGTAVAKIFKPDGNEINEVSWTGTGSQEWNYSISNPSLAASPGVYTVSIFVQDANSGRIGFGFATFEILPSNCMLTVKVKQAGPEYLCPAATVIIENTSQTYQLTTDANGSCFTNLPCGQYKISATWISNEKQYVGSENIILPVESSVLVEVYESGAELFQKLIGDLGTWHSELLWAAENRAEETSERVKQAIARANEYEFAGNIIELCDIVKGLRDSAAYSFAGKADEAIKESLLTLQDESYWIASDILTESAKASTFGEINFLEADLKNHPCGLTDESLLDLCRQSANTYSNLVTNHYLQSYPTPYELMGLTTPYDHELSALYLSWTNYGAGLIKSPNLNSEVLAGIVNSYSDMGHGKSRVASWNEGTPFFKSERVEATCPGLVLPMNPESQAASPWIGFFSLAEETKQHANNYEENAKRQFFAKVLETVGSYTLDFCTGGIGFVATLVYNGATALAEHGAALGSLKDEQLLQSEYWEHMLRQISLDAPLGIVGSYNEGAAFLAQEINNPKYSINGATLSEVVVSDVEVQDLSVDLFSNSLSGQLSGKVHAKITNNNNISGKLRVLGVINSTLSDRYVDELEPYGSQWVTIPFVVPIEYNGCSARDCSEDDLNIYLIPKKLPAIVSCDVYFGPRRFGNAIEARIPKWVRHKTNHWPFTWEYEPLTSQQLTRMAALSVYELTDVMTPLADQQLTTSNSEVSVACSVPENSFEAVFEFCAPVGRDVVSYVVDEEGKRVGFSETSSVVEFPAELSSVTLDFNRIVIPNCSGKTYTMVMRLVNTGFAESHRVKVYGYRVPLVSEARLATTENLQLYQVQNGSTGIVSIVVRETTAQKPLTNVAANLTDLAGPWGNLSPTTDHLQTTNVVPGGGSSTFSWLFNVPSAVTGWYSGTLSISCAESQERTNDVILLTPPAYGHLRKFKDNQDMLLLDFSSTVAQTVYIPVPRFMNIRFTSVRVEPVGDSNVIVSLDVGNDGTNEWGSSEPLLGPANAYDLSPAIQEYLVSCAGSGNYCDVPITISVNNTATVALTDLHCLYDFPDTDSDGMSDIWEQQIVDANQNDTITSIEQVLPEDDFDHDGFTNLEEYMRGSDPTDQNDVPQMTTFYVDDDAPGDPSPNDAGISDPVENGSAQHPFDEIQEAIDIATNRDAVVVLTGRYYENITFNGKNVVLTSTDPNDPNIVSNTIIDGNNAGSVVAFTGTENASCLLTGFTITNGYSNSPYTEGNGGGVYGAGTHSSIRKCIVTGNLAGESHEIGYGGGIYDCDGLIEDCNISNNDTGKGGGGLAYCDGTIRACTIASNETHGSPGGGGLYHCNGLIENCTIVQNSNGCIGCERDGGGLYGCSGTIKNCIITNNIASWWGGGFIGCHGTIANCYISNNTSAGSGGGLYDCDANIIDCVIACNTNTGNRGEAGGGIANCDGKIINCTIVGNQSLYEIGNSGRGGGLYHCNGNINNCIIWGNIADIDGNQIYLSSEPNYSCIKDWIGGGVGNISTDPCFVSSDSNDFHLLSNSTCIDRGDPNHQWDLNEFDIDGDARIIGGRVDIGADEYAFGKLSDFDGNGQEDLIDFAIFAQAWMSQPGQPNWNPACDISSPKDDIIDWSDLAVFVEYWLAGIEYSPPTISAGDFDGNGQEDLMDFAILASAWMSQPGETNWNQSCDISDPKDNIIDWTDLAVFVADWLAGVK